MHPHHVRCLVLRVLRVVGDCFNEKKTSPRRRAPRRAKEFFFVTPRLASPQRRAHLKQSLERGEPPAPLVPVARRESHLRLRCTRYVARVQRRAQLQELPAHGRGHVRTVQFPKQASQALAAVLNLSLARGVRARRRFAGAAGGAAPTARSAAPAARSAGTAPVAADAAGDSMIIAPLGLAINFFASRYNLVFYYGTDGRTQWPPKGP